MEDLTALVDSLAGQIMPVFGLSVSAPKIKLVNVAELIGEANSEAMPACIEYKKGVDETSICVSPDWYKKLGYSREVIWALSEEISHHCHNKIKRVLWDEALSIAEMQHAGTWTQGNRRILEIKNLIELVGRIGGYHGGMTPPDVSQTLAKWEELMRKAPQTFEHFENLCENNDKFASAVYYLSNRVWGCHIGDIIAFDSETHLLPKPKLVQALAKCASFLQVAETYRRMYPKKTAIYEEIEKIANRF